MTVEKYATLAGMPGYAEEGDLVVEAPDGSFAAFTMVWWSQDAGVGEFEPVGTHPDHQRRGLGRAVNLAGLHRLRDLGAIDALVFSRTTNAASEALYRSVGFEAITHHRASTARSDERRRARVTGRPHSPPETSGRRKASEGP